MIKLSLSKLLTLLIASFSLVLSPMVYGGSGAATEFEAASATDYANTIEGSDHTSENKIHIFCDSGGANMTSPDQQCVIRLHALIGIKGEISSTYRSKVAITDLAISLPTSGSGYTNTTGSGGDFSALTGELATTTPDNYVNASTTSNMAGSDHGVTSGSNTLAGHDSESGTGAGMTADNALCFSGESRADIKWDGSSFNENTGDESVVDIVGADADNEAV